MKMSGYHVSCTTQKKLRGEGGQITGTAPWFAGFLFLPFPFPFDRYVFCVGSEVSTISSGVCKNLGDQRRRRVEGRNGRKKIYGDITRQQHIWAFLSPTMEMVVCGDRGRMRKEVDLAICVWAESSCFESNRFGSLAGSGPSHSWAGKNARQANISFQHWISQFCCWAGQVTLNLGQSVFFWLQSVSFGCQSTDHFVESVDWSVAAPI